MRLLRVMREYHVIGGFKKKENHIKYFFGSKLKSSKVTQHGWVGQVT